MIETMIRCIASINSCSRKLIHATENPFWIEISEIGPFHQLYVLVNYDQQTCLCFARVDRSGASASFLWESFTCTQITFYLTFINSWCSHQPKNRANKWSVRTSFRSIRAWISWEHKLSSYKWSFISKQTSSSYELEGESWIFKVVFFWADC
jgi:hypothetical protein